MCRIRGFVFFALIAAACTGYDIPYQPPPISDAGDDEPPTDDKGVFVSNMGSDANDGTMEAPVRTIGKALTLLGGKPNVYVCAGNYAEQVVLDGSISVSDIYGGFDCTSWQYNAGNQTVVKSPNSDYALKIADFTSLITISDMEFDARDATTSGASSIAVFVSNANVKFERSAIVAGKGNDGADGQTRSNYSGSNAPSGNPASGSTGGTARTCACTNNSITTGGHGGNGGSPATNGDVGTPFEDCCGLAGVANQTCGTGAVPGTGGGQWGAHGDDGLDGVGAAAPPAGTVTAAFGSLDNMGWHPALSAAGEDGRTGQGGGGGGGSYNASTGATGGGGGGGCGGCGGAGGGAAQAGGASIALLSFRSTVTLDDSSLSAGNAGNGGVGAIGQSYQWGSDGGAGGANGGCQGGGGGEGGNGGASAGGAGGVSAGVLWIGDVEPAHNAATRITSGSAGVKGAGGKPGVNNGPSGVAGAVLQVTP
ncbi:MAG: DUF1565 domain-containing protein [Polyangiaceae bacterium]|nr:DUF1565 domain-containing protein [Polyangiaceae bacterium]